MCVNFRGAANSVTAPQDDRTVAAATDFAATKAVAPDTLTRTSAEAIKEDADGAPTACREGVDASYWDKRCDADCVAAMFSEEQSLHALGLLDEGYDVDDVAIFVGCSTHSIDRWRRALLKTGSVWPDPHLRNKHADAAVRNVDLMRAVKLLVENEPAAPLRDHVDVLVTLSTH